MDRESPPIAPAILVDRAPIGVLKDEEDFLHFAQHLKALWLRLAERERVHRGVRSTLTRQIDVFQTHCDALAASNARCRAMWLEVKKELEPLKAGLAARQGG